MKNIIKCIGRFLAVTLAVLLVFGIIDLILSEKSLSVTSYELESGKITNPIRIVHLTDLHNSEFGKGNSRLIKKVEKQSPDLILITGDLVNSKTGGDSLRAEKLIEGLSSVAPVYVSYGNQEYNTELKDESWGRYSDIYEAAGATVLDKEWVDIDINGQAIRLGGIYGYCQPEKFAQETRRFEESAFLKEFQDTERYTILMCHIPLCWISSKSMYDWDVDLVYSGHFHGGQIIIPFVGGLWAPDMGWFPGRVDGLYESEEDQWQEAFDSLKKYAGSSMDNSYYNDERSYYKTSVIVSRGLGNTEWVPRFNNIPEIVVTDVGTDPTH